MILANLLEALMRCWIYVPNKWKTLGCIRDVDEEERVAKKILAGVPKLGKLFMHMQNTTQLYVCKS
jgi:hypothetical protein